MNRNGFIVVVVVAAGLAAGAVVAAVEAASDKEACATKVVQGPRGFRGAPGPQGERGPQGPAGEVPWFGILLAAFVSGVAGAGLVLALRRDEPTIFPAPSGPVHIHNNVYGGQPPAPPARPAQAPPAAA